MNAGAENRTADRDYKDVLHAFQMDQDVQDYSSRGEESEGGYASTGPDSDGGGGRIRRARG